MSEDIKKPMSSKEFRNLANDKAKTVIKGANPHIKRGAVQKVIKGSDFLKKIASLRAAKKGAKMLSAVVPFAGMALSALSLSSGDAAASLPLGGVESMGLKPGDEGYTRDNPVQGKKLTPLDRALINKKFKERNK